MVRSQGCNHQKRMQKIIMESSIPQEMDTRSMLRMRTNMRLSYRHLPHHFCLAPRHVQKTKKKTAEKGLVRPRNYGAIDPLELQKMFVKNQHGSQQILWNMKKGDAVNVTILAVWTLSLSLSLFLHFFWTLLGASSSSQAPFFSSLALKKQDSRVKNHTNISKFKCFILLPKYKHSMFRQRLK